MDFYSLDEDVCLFLYDVQKGQQFMVNYQQIIISHETNGLEPYGENFTEYTECYALKELREPRKYDILQTGG